ncbi:outer membrane protein assembly factor BamE [Variovorax sp. DXTD-1]|uniref:outer membrane protein assembly factor BamE domain-containing protein n=1 Tax=Variovorax sp. DXTD-1 TaxID=2495592 RepID=UPI000F86F072|nr:outer membrane protein assembly factor BamE [Variovorax sp. DXTD-1]RST46316.1 outer membrane protein assembly factor BamE [Variovorax sp. DXTD-1]
MKKIVIGGVIFVAALLSGCGTLGGNTAVANATTQSLEQQLKKGVTTTDDVKRIFGSPNSVQNYADGTEYWIYDSGRNNQTSAIFSMIPGSSTVGRAEDIAGTKSKSMSIFFDSRKRVVRHTLTTR